MRIQNLKTKLWFNIFVRVGIIFAVFVLVLSLSNVAFLVRFFSLKEKNALIEQLNVVSELDFNQSNEVVKKLTEINDKYNFDVEIYNNHGAILYTTHGGQMMDFFQQKNDRFSMSHEEMIPIETKILKDGITFQRAVRRFDQNEFLLCKKQISNDYYAEIRVQQQLISNSANIANEFIVIISVIFLGFAIIWILIFARQFSKPISEMNDITKNMAKLNFNQKLKSNRSDEIGQLAISINNMSDSLSAALEDLKTTNAKLRDEIELERQLDVMRKGFVANVSHELKTPISIISGYAEGLKLNINAESKDAYCDTIIEESHRMNRLVLSILELSRYESGQIPLNKQNFDISTLCGDMMKRIFKGKNICFHNQILPQTTVFADALQIEQVLKSLLENAVAHTPEGGRVIADCEEKGENLRITIFNSGSHVDESIMPEIWQSFYRGDKSHKRESSRFGLGLSIVTAIMKLHGTSCGVYNTEDGVCFWFEVSNAQKTQS